jgi:branched-chain amino acid aminotransferase
MSADFTITRTQNPKTKPAEDKLKFGVDFTDHMFIMDWETDKGWHDARIVPYGPLSLDPATVCFHYAQVMFEGMKAYKTPEGKILLFRPEMNAQRSNRTCERLCMPTIHPHMFIKAVQALVSIDKDWIPQAEGTSLYIRPFMIADEPFVGVRPSNHYKFIIILSPVGPYYASGLKPTKIYVEDKYVRAAIGGTGDIKCGGNYAASLKAQVVAAEKGYDQVLWLDGVERKFVEEIGTSNAFFVIDDEIITAPLGGTILPGITRNSVIALLKKRGVKVVEKRLSIDIVYEAARTGRLKEVFATGTAAVISPVGTLCYNDECVTINNNEVGPIAQELYDTLYGMQTGKRPDEMKWTVEVK